MIDFIIFGECLYGCLFLRHLEWEFGNILESGCKSFSKFVRFEVGVGSKVSFWHNVWCGDSLLKKSYLDLFTRKDAWEADNRQFREWIIFY